MTDSQWPRFEVFKQDNLKKRHEAVGSVHAADAELALQNARDVFVRRPSAVSLWVAPAAAIFALTREELEAKPDWWREDEDEMDKERPPRLRGGKLFHIFTKTNQRRSMTFVQHVGEVNGRSPRHALHKAMESGQFDNDKVWVWWVVADEAISRSQAEDIDSLFAPAKDKTYRQQSHYGFVSPRHQKRKHGQPSDAP
jgi:ring-1,2-phenylacetyl-CoA epoxidase subunit PaaB